MTYTFNVTSGKATTATRQVLKPSAAGDVVVTVSRAADENYSSATVMKTIKVTPRPLKAEIAASAPKTYDGNVTATVRRLHCPGIIGNDVVNTNPMLLLLPLTQVRMSVHQRSLFLH